MYYKFPENYLFPIEERRDLVLADLFIDENKTRCASQRVYEMEIDDEYVEKEINKKNIFS